MEFSFDDANNVYSHFMLSDMDLATSIAKTPGWVADKNCIASVQINGVPVPAEIIDKELKRWYDGLAKQVRQELSPEGYEKRIEDEVERRIKERANGVLEQLDILAEKLRDSNDLIKPHWDR